MRREKALCGVAALLSAGVPTVAWGQAQTMALAFDPARSSVTLSGNIGGNTIRQQGTGSLTTRYSGGVFLEYVPDTSVRFLPGGEIRAANSGTWQPGTAGAAGSAPANYGLQVTFLFFLTARAAIRELTLTPSSGDIALLAGGSFDSGGITFTALSGLVDYNAPTIAVGQQSMVGSSGLNTTLTPSTLVTGPGGVMTLTIPVSTSFDVAVLPGATAPDSRFTLTGQLVATGTPAIPEPGGLAVLGVVGVAALGRRRRLGLGGG